MHNRVFLSCSHQLNLWFMLKMTKLVVLSHTDPDGCIAETVTKRAVGDTSALPFPKFEESLATFLLPVLLMFSWSADGWGKEGWFYSMLEIFGILFLLMLD